MTYSASSSKYKTNIVDLSQNTSNIYELKTREFDYIDGNHTVGLIAEEVNEIDSLLTTKDDGVTPSNINWNVLQTYMIKELQNLRNEMNDLTSDYENLSISISDLEKLCK
jgi:hypothetical protein